MFFMGKDEVVLLPSANADDKNSSVVPGGTCLADFTFYPAVPAGLLSSAPAGAVGFLIEEPCPKPAWCTSPAVNLQVVASRGLQVECLGREVISKLRFDKLSLLQTNEDIHAFRSCDPSRGIPGRIPGSRQIRLRPRLSHTAADLAIAERTHRIRHTTESRDVPEGRIVQGPRAAQQVSP